MFEDRKLLFRRKEELERLAAAVGLKGSRATGGQLTADKLLANFESGAFFASQVIPLARPMR